MVFLWSIATLLLSICQTLSTVIKYLKTFAYAVNISVFFLSGLMNKMGVKLKRGKPYTPQHGGRYEKAHHTVKTKMAQFVNEDGSMTCKEALKAAVYLYK